VLRPIAIAALFALGLAACAQVGGEKDKTDAGPSPCDGKDSCAECEGCARQSVCADETSRCAENSFCVGLNDCLGQCGGVQQCELDCYAANQPGAGLYDALRICVICDACPTDCAGFEECE
jgi:hypothetical protein